ncbi:MAG TPA: POTRA domain-containing protein [Terriglobales bacterium]|nr:POTRA domain-containing protein [Terriglobales bacterium]
MNHGFQTGKLLASAAIFCVFLSPLVCAQKRATAKAQAQHGTPSKLLSLKVTGTTRYTEKEILGASGLKLGQDAAQGEFQEAAQRLGKSGLFSSVSFSFSYNDAGVKAEFQLADKQDVKLLPARFENFVWFSDAELHSFLEERVPLFKDSLLPSSGALADRVNEALQSLLSERNLPGRVDYLRESKQDGSELAAIVFRVEEVIIHIRNVEFPGASQEQAELLEKGVHQLVDAEYFRSKLVAVAKFDLLPILCRRGYLKAVFGPSEAKVVSGPGTPSTGASQQSESAGSNEVEVDAILPATPGKIYSVSGVDWKGNSAVATEEASHLFHLTVGRPADGVRVTTDGESLTRLYHSRGYMTAEVRTDAQLDDEKSTVHYDINITEGDLYKMGELEIVGVDTPSKDRLHDAWKLREGQPYNAEYTKQFLDDAARLLPRGLQYSVNVHEELNKKDKAVEVTIQYKVQ